MSAISKAFHSNGQEHVVTSSYELKTTTGDALLWISYPLACLERAAITHKSELTRNLLHQRGEIC